MGYFLISYNA